MSATGVEIKAVRHIVAENLTHTVCGIALSDGQIAAVRHNKPQFVMYGAKLRQKDKECSICYATENKLADENKGFIIACEPNCRDKSHNHPITLLERFGGDLDSHCQTGDKPCHFVHKCIIMPLGKPT